jgi:mono/diheme cytochrome c family protein
MLRRRVVAIASLAMVALLVPNAAFAGAAPLYKTNCAVCHGPDGSGQTPAGKSVKARDLRSAEVQSESDAELSRVIREGKDKMPSYKERLSAADVASLVAYIREMKK